MRTLIVAVVVVAAGVTACTSSSKTTSPTTGPPTTVPVPVTTTTALPSFTGSSASPFCVVAGPHRAAFALSSFTTKTPAQLKAIYADRTALDRAGAAAPPVIRRDVTSFVAALRAILGPLAAADYNFENLSPTTYATFATPQITAASDRVEQYLRAVCRVGAG